MSSNGIATIEDIAQMAQEPTVSKVAPVLDMSPAKVHEDRPVVDTKNVSWGDSKKIQLLQMKSNKAVAAGDEEQAMELLEEMQALLPRFVQFVPRSWLVEDAPSDLKWSNAESFDYLQSSRFYDLLACIGEKNQEVVDNAKN
jgi:hypothetical protein